MKSFGIKIVCISIVVATELSALGVSFGEDIKNDTLDVLLVFSSGTPFKTISEVRHSDLDAVSTATPKEINCRTIAERLKVLLVAKGLVVRLAEADEIKSVEEILRARIVVFGSPGYFSNVSWEIKRILDRYFGRIYVMAKEERIRLQVAAYAMAEGEYAANGAIKAIKAAVEDCKGKFGPISVFLTKENEERVEKRIKRFAEGIEKEMKGN